MLEPICTSSSISVFVLVAVLNGLMTYYTYFKDCVGDKAAGKKTFVVKSGLGQVCENCGRATPHISLFHICIFIVFHLNKFAM